MSVSLQQLSIEDKDIQDHRPPELLVSTEPRGTRSVNLRVGVCVGVLSREGTCKNQS